MEIIVHRPGAATTLQDLGRRGSRAIGVPLGGAMDPFALRVANMLVGNPPDAAALEIAGVGPELEFSSEALVAITGAEFAAIEAWRPQLLKKSRRLDLGKTARGFYGYLAVAGGFDVPAVLQSRGTYLRGGIGGLGGRILRRGDLLRTFPAPPPRLFRWRLDPRILPLYSSTPTLRVIAGPQAAEFTNDFYTGEFVASPRSDRVGLRLAGRSLVREGTGDLLSQPMATGTIQVPADGHPILLMADAPTIGGYPQVGNVCSVDLSLAAQLRPGDRARFAPISLEAAEHAWLAQQRALGFLEEGLALQFA